MGPSRLTRTGLMVGAIAALAACADTASTRFISPDASLGNIPGGGTAPLTTNAPVHELFKVCKVYSGAVGPAVTVTVTAPGVSNFNVVLTNGQCRSVWVQGDAQAALENVSVTEAVPTGYTATWTKATIVNGVVSSTGGSGNTASGDVGANPLTGVVVTFTNTEIPPPPVSAEGRMTGGGVQFFGQARISRGFTIHCDIILSNNLEINWPGNKWHIDKPLTFAFCSDDPNIDHGPPAAPFDTFYGEGVGKLNGVDGATIKFTFIDAGEPGKNDKTQIQIWDVNGNLVLSTPLSTLVHGNIQAHYDQPHGNKP